MGRIIKPDFQGQGTVGQIRARQRAKMREQNEKKQDAAVEKADSMLRNRPDQPNLGPPVELDPTLLDEADLYLRLAKDGHAYKDIARMAQELLHRPVTTSRVRKLVLREMARVKDPIVRDIRRMEDVRLDYLLTKLGRGIESGDVHAIHEARGISESRRKMWGADMPANVRVTGDVQHHLDPAVEDLLQQSKDRQAQREANDRLAIDDGRIIEAEIVADEADPDYRVEPYLEEDQSFDEVEETDLIIERDDHLPDD